MHQIFLRLQFVILKNYELSINRSSNLNNGITLKINGTKSRLQHFEHTLILAGFLRQLNFVVSWPPSDAAGTLWKSAGICWHNPAPVPTRKHDPSTNPSMWVGGRSWKYEKINFSWTTQSMSVSQAASSEHFQWLRQGPYVGIQIKIPRPDL